LNESSEEYSLRNEDAQEQESPIPRSIPIS
jgi:hypothetical protein